MKKSLLILAVVALATALFISITHRLLIRGNNSANQVGLSNREGRGRASTSVSSSSATKSKSYERRVSLRELKEVGFIITADKLTEYGASGNVKVISPNGDSATGDGLVLSSTDDKFYLTGELKFQVTKGERVFTMESWNDDAFVTFDSTGGVLETSEHIWALSSGE